MRIKFVILYGLKVMTYSGYRFKIVGNLSLLIFFSIATHIVYLLHFNNVFCQIGIIIMNFTHTATWN